QGEDYELYVELERRGRDTLADLELLPIAVTPGVNLPLGSIASIDVTHSFARLTRRDSVRTVTVAGSVAPDEADAAEVGGRFVAEAGRGRERELADVRLATGGAAKQSAEGLGSMGRRMAVGLFGVFVLLSLQFRSYIAPVVVRMAIPFAFAGVVWGHLLMG